MTSAIIFKSLGIDSIGNLSMQKPNEIAGTFINKFKLNSYHDEMFERKQVDLSQEKNIKKHINLPQEYNENDEVEQSQVELAVNSMMRQKMKVNLARGVIGNLMESAKKAEQ